MSNIRILGLVLFVLLPMMTTAFIIVFDIWIFNKLGRNETISAAMRDLGRFPLVPFSTGLTIGLFVGGMAAHFWWAE